MRRGLNPYTRPCSRLLQAAAEAASRGSEEHPAPGVGEAAPEHRASHSDVRARPDLHGAVPGSGAHCGMELMLSCHWVWGNGRAELGVALVQISVGLFLAVVHTGVWSCCFA